MRNVTADNITETFINYLGDKADPRVREVLGCLAKHLHEFAREVHLTHDEWNTALKFLEQTGNITTGQRNEFILLSDVMGLSSLVDMINSHPDGTNSSVLGPFHISGAPRLNVGGDLKRDFSGEVVLWEGMIKDRQGKPVSGAKVDIWQTAPNGLYSSQDSQQDTYSFHGIITTGEDGRYAFTTVRPVSYTIPTDGPVGQILNAADRHPWRPSHMHFIVQAEGYRDLVTEVFPDDDPYLDEDTVFGVREDLVITYERQEAGSFPEGFELSGKVDDAYSKVEFDITMIEMDNG